MLNHRLQFAYTLHDGLERIAGFRRELHPGRDLFRYAIHRLDGIFHFLLHPFDHPADLRSRRGRPLGEFSDLIGHHGETPSLLARAGRFYGRIQRQQVGLVRDTVDDADDLPDLLRFLAQQPDRSR